MTVLSGSGTSWWAASSPTAPPLPLLRTDDGGLGSASALTESAAAARVVSAVAGLL